jgi:hypothetical protein
MNGIQVRANIGSTDIRFFSSTMPLSLAYFSLLVYPGLHIIDIVYFFVYLCIYPIVIATGGCSRQEGNYFQLPLRFFFFTEQSPSVVEYENHPSRLNLTTTHMEKEIPPVPDRYERKDSN